MKLLIVLSAIFLLLAIVAGEEIQPTIVNGTDAEIAEFPYVVALRYNSSLSCAGTLLNDYWILTAAHCLFGDPSLTTIEYATTVIGENGVNGTKLVEIERYIRHEDYNGALIRDDIGLIKLKAPLFTGLHGAVSKLAIPGSYYRTGTPTTVVGWGRIGTNLPISLTLQKVDLQIYSYEDCRAAHLLSPSDLDIYRTNICAGVPEMGKSECNGDSGGPLLVNNVQVGIVSWSLKPCAVAPYPGVYTAVSTYLDWIIHHTGIQFELNTFLIRKV